MKHAVLGIKLIDGKYHLSIYSNGNYDYYEIDKDNLKALNVPHKRLCEEFDRVNLSSDFFHPDEFPEIPKKVFDVFNP